MKSQSLKVRYIARYVNTTDFENEVRIDIAHFEYVEHAKVFIAAEIAYLACKLKVSKKSLAHKYQIVNVSSGELVP